MSRATVCRVSIQSALTVCWMVAAGGGFLFEFLAMRVIVLAQSDLPGGLARWRAAVRVRARLGVALRFP